MYLLSLYQFNKIIFLKRSYWPKSLSVCLSIYLKANSGIVYIAHYYEMIIWYNRCSIFQNFCKCTSMRTVWPDLKCSMKNIIETIIPLILTFNSLCPWYSSGNNKCFCKSLDEESNKAGRERGKERDASLPTTACAERQTSLSKPFCFSGVVKDTVGQTSIRISCEVRLKAAQRRSCVRLRWRRVISIKDEGYKQEGSQRIGRERPSICVNSGILTQGHQDDFRRCWWRLVLCESDMRQESWWTGFMNKCGTKHPFKSVEWFRDSHMQSVRESSLKKTLNMSECHCITNEISEQVSLISKMHIHTSQATFCLVLFILKIKLCTL